jgi:hypothetical protein
MTLLALAPAWAQEVRPLVSFGNAASIVADEFSVNRSIELPAVSMAEVLGLGGLGAALRAESVDPAGAALATSLGAWSGTAPSIAFPDAGIVRRTVEDAWQVRIDTSTRRDAYLDVGYQIYADNGTAGMLSNVSDRTSQIAVRLEPITPVVVGVEDGYELLQGGLIFHLDLATVRRSGRYQGALTVTFNNF